MRNRSGGSVGPDDFEAIAQRGDVIRLGQRSRDRRIMRTKMQTRAATAAGSGLALPEGDRSGKPCWRDTGARCVFPAHSHRLRSATPASHTPAKNSPDGRLPTLRRAEWKSPASETNFPLGQANLLDHVIEHHHAAQRCRQGRDEQAVIFSGADAQQRSRGIAAQSVGHQPLVIEQSLGVMALGRETKACGKQ